MPEGPEVEIVRRDLIDYLKLKGRMVKHISLTEYSQKYPKYKGKQPEFDKFDNQVIEDIVRIGKYLVWKFSQGAILNHLGMSGRWIKVDGELNPKEAAKLSNHQKVIIEMAQPPHAIFDDVRNFGQFKAFNSYEEVCNHRPVKKVLRGIDSLERPFRTKDFIKRISNPKLTKPVAEILLKQHIVSGIGNIYKSESLFEAKIDPTRSISTLTQAEKNTLAKAIVVTIDKALKYNGSTFGRGQQQYIRPSGLMGEAQQWHSVYGREGKPCLVCKTPIRRIVQEERSTFYCPNCQK